MVRVQEQGAMLTNRQHKHPGVQLDGRKDEDCREGKRKEGDAFGIDVKCRGYPLWITVR